MAVLTHLVLHSVQVGSQLNEPQVIDSRNITNVTMISMDKFIENYTLWLGSEQDRRRVYLHNHTT